MSPKPTRRRDHPPPKTGTDERDVLVGFLDYLRSSIAAKAEDVPEPHVRTPGVPSGTNLLGLIKHLTSVERATFLAENVTDWPATFHAKATQTVPEVLSAYRDATAQANKRITNLDLTTTLPHPNHAPTLRWALVHLIEETARHAGHADILRELIDGRTGR